jgi:hypothetical protein
MASDLPRRDVLRGFGVGALLAVVPRAALHAPGRKRPSGRGRFLTKTGLDTLRAVTAHLLPGPPDDPDPGALEAGCAEAIDLLLAAFSFDPPLIHAGGPFSDRAGARRDDMARFVRLDATAALGWRIRLEGTRGRPERSFAGEVVGLQQIYRDGLARLAGFAAATPADRETMLRDDIDFATTVLADALDVMYGAPEYGGNRGLVGWHATGFAGDVQPRGYTAAQVSTLDATSSAPLDGGAARAALVRYIIGINLVDVP